MEQRLMHSSREGNDSGRPVPEAMAPALLDWYDRNRRDLPWRAAPGEAADPYRVWLSEIMLQQTTVATVRSYFDAFLRRWPTVSDLAAAPLDDVLHAWQGLGYYARARNLHKCAKAVAGDHDGIFPSTDEELLGLPGIGPYTAGAIAAIAFGRRSVPVDGNIERVFSRIYRMEDENPVLKRRVAEAAAPLVPERSGDFWQAAMDLGATVCRPRRPLCLVCPWHGFCAAHRDGVADSYPRKTRKAAKPTRRGMAFLMTGPDGAILLRRRPPSGLLGGMVEVPSTDWRETPWTLDEALASAPAGMGWEVLEEPVKHTFTHFHLELTVVLGRAATGLGKGEDGFWCLPENLSGQALPTVMKKVLRRAQVL